MTDDPTQAVPSAAVVAGRYRLDALIGRGGTAEVWRATDLSLDRVVALKLVTVDHDESSARAADEAKTLARLSHPSLVQVYDAGTDNAGRPWVVMELVEGETLADAMRRGPLSVVRITEIGAAVAEALDHVHAQGLVHRDVKPANVLLRRSGGAKLTDFGIARLVDAARVTSTGLMVGTAAYLAPEQVTGEQVGAPADVYALGLVLLEALTGVREYDGPAVEAAMARLHRSPAMPTSLPDGYADLLTAMTSRYPEDRPTAGQVGQALRGLLAGGSVTTVLPQAVTQTQALPRTTALAKPVETVAPVAPPARSKAPLVAAAGVLVLVLGAAGFLLANPERSQPRQVPQVSDQLPREIKDPLDRIVKDTAP